MGPSRCGITSCEGVRVCGMKREAGGGSEEKSRQRTCVVAEHRCMAE